MKLLLGRLFVYPFIDSPELQGLNMGVCLKIKFNWIFSEITWLLKDLPVSVPFILFF